MNPPLNPKLDRWRTATWVQRNTVAFAASALWAMSYPGDKWRLSLPSRADGACPRRRTSSSDGGCGARRVPCSPPLEGSPDPGEERTADRWMEARRGWQPRFDTLPRQVAPRRRASCPWPARTGGGARGRLGRCLADTRAPAPPPLPTPLHLGREGRGSARGWHIRGGCGWATPPKLIDWYIENVWPSCRLEFVWS
jgi:hypothetical protein